MEEVIVYPEDSLRAQALNGDFEALKNLENIWYEKYSPSIECFLCQRSFHEEAYKEHQDSCLRRQAKRDGHVNILIANQEKEKLKLGTILYRVKKEPLYHQKIAYANTNQINFFCDFRSDSQISEINIHPDMKTGSLPHSKMFKIYGMSIIPNDTKKELLDDYLKIWKSGTLKFKIGSYTAVHLLSKNVLTNPAELPRINQEELITGLDSLKFRHNLTVGGTPLEILCLQPIEVTLEWQEYLTQDIPLYCVLYGLLLSGINS